MTHTALATERREEATSVQTPEVLLVNKETAARMLQVSEKTLDKFMLEFGLPCVRLGRNVRYSVDALRKWIAERGGN